MKNLKSKLSTGDKLEVNFPFILIIIAMSMHGKRVVPQAIEAFNVYFGAVLPYITTNAVRLGIHAGDVTALAAHMNDVGTGYKDLHTKHSNVATKTKDGTHDLMDKERVITILLGHAYQNIDRRIMTNTDYETLHISKPVDHNTPRAAITNAPFGIMYSRTGAVMHFIVRIAVDGSHASMDPLADEIEVRGAFLAPDAALPTDPMACGIVFTSTSAIINHQFLVGDIGKKFFCFIRYKNTADVEKSGPWIALVPAFIS